MQMDTCKKQKKMLINEKLKIYIDMPKKRESKKAL